MKQIWSEKMIMNWSVNVNDTSLDFTNFFSSKKHTNSSMLTKNIYVIKIVFVNTWILWTKRYI